MKTFGDELRRLRRQKKLSLIDLANAIGCSIVHISEIERNMRNPPSSDKIRKLLTELDAVDLLDDMLVLAVRSKNVVAIRLSESTTPDLERMLVTLARKVDSNELSVDEIAELTKILNGR